MGRSTKGPLRGPFVILEQESSRRRVVFFCGCESPWRAHECHRTMVREALLGAARARKVDLSLEEWPGGEVAERSAPAVRVRRGTLKSLGSGGQWATLEDQPGAELLGLATGSLVSLEEGRESLIASVCPARFVAGRWKLQTFVAPEPGQSQKDLLRAVHRERQRLQLGPRRT